MCLQPNENALTNCAEFIYFTGCKAHPAINYIIYHQISAALLPYDAAFNLRKNIYPPHLQMFQILSDIKLNSFLPLPQLRPCQNPVS